MCIYLMPIMSLAILKQVSAFIEMAWLKLARLRGEREVEIIIKSNNNRTPPRQKLFMLVIYVKSININTGHFSTAARKNECVIVREMASCHA